MLHFLPASFSRESLASSPNFRNYFPCAPVIRESLRGDLRARRKTYCELARTVEGYVECSRRGLTGQLAGLAPFASSFVEC